MTTPARITIGDACRYSCQLLASDGTNESSIAAATGVKLRIVRKDRSAGLSPVYVLSSGFAGASWSTALVAGEIAAADLASVTERRAHAEVEVTFAANDVRSYHTDDLIELLPGNIP